MLLTAFVDRYGSFTFAICSGSEISVVKLTPEPIRQIDSDICLTRCISGC